MKRYIAILRGINVGGRRKIKMADLKILLAKLEFEKVLTYIQSGNVLFDTAQSTTVATLETQIANTIKEAYGFEVPVIVRTVEEIRQIASSNPFLSADTPLERLHLTFLGEQPTEEHQTKTETYDYTPDEFTIVGKNVYVYCANGYGKTKLNNTFFEKKLKVKATTRNWKTMNKLVELSNA